MEPVSIGVFGNCGHCGNCQSPFQKESSKVKQILVCAPNNNITSRECDPYHSERGDEIISIYEALSTIFEIPPLTPTGIDGGALTRKEVYNKGSKFMASVNSNPDGDDDDTAYSLCINCSETLKDLYRCFEKFTKVCKLDSEIGIILKNLGKETTTNKNGTHSSVVVVKTEPVDSDDEHVSENEHDADDTLEVAEGSNQDPAVVIKQAPPDSDDDNTGRQSRPSSPDAPLSENEETSAPPRTSRTSPPKMQKITINLPGGRGVITQLQCPHCDKQFLHENTLICHRRIVHRENIQISRPSTLPQIFLSPRGHSDRLRALADSNGKTSACPICRMEVTRTDIRLHLAAHTRSLSKPWLCTICGQNFNDQSSLRGHSRVHVRGIPCKRCGKRIPVLEMLHHIRQCMSRAAPPTGLDFSCKVCHKAFRTSDQLIDHRSHAHNHFWKCKLCGIKFRDRAKMQKHMNTHKQKKMYKCRICDKSFDRSDVLRLHVKRFHRNNEAPPPSVQRSVPLETGDDADFNNFPPDHHDASPIPSPSGASKSTSQPDSDWTLPDSLREKRFVCKGCALQFSKASELDTHLLDAHTEPDSFLCKICNRVLQDAYCLKLHVKTHGEMKPMECFHTNCGKVYRDKNTFFFHLKEKHEMDTKSITLRYPDIFRQKNRDYSTRYVRKRVADPAVPKIGKFPCEICGRIFPQVYGLRSHIKLVHDKIREFLCKYCGKAFARKSYFLLHEKLHTSNEAPYKCHLCNKGFRLPGNLRMHLQSILHNPNRDYVCDVCGKRFNRNDNLRLHVKTVHLKIPVRKPRTEASDRYTHGGRNRIYVGGEHDIDDPGGDGSAANDNLRPEPIPGTSQTFFPQQTTPLHHQQFPTPSAFQRHDRGNVFRPADSSSMDSSSHFSGDIGEQVTGKHSPTPIDVGSHQQQEGQQSPHHPHLSMPLLQNLPHEGRSGGHEGDQNSYTLTGYSLRNFQYRL